MNLVFRLFGVKKQKKTLKDYQEEMVEKIGREQFKKLLDRGLQVPVVML